LNILIQNDDHIVKLGDFGHSIEPDEPELPGKVFGTQSYQALDVTKPEGYEMAPLDVFSCGVVLIALLTGCEPFFRYSANDLYDDIKEQRYVLFWKRLERLSNGASTDLSPEAKDLFLGMVSYDPSERFTIEKVLDHDWLKDESKSATLDEVKAQIKRRIVQIAKKRDEMSIEQQMDI
jgi:serine/threonine protein kinase